jgi:hypothetical protein
MIEKDRALLARLARVNQQMGEFVVDNLFEGQDGGELPAAGLRDLGNGLVALGTDVLARADELEGRT